MEISTEEHEQAVARAYERASKAIAEEQPISDELRLIYNIEHLMQEANSGASFEQYFRWASLEEIRQVSDQLSSLGLTDVVDLLERAIEIAFPSGLPASYDAKDEATDWSAEQEEDLSELFTSLEELNGHVMNVLGAYVLRIGA